MFENVCKTMICKRSFFGLVVFYNKQKILKKKYKARLFFNTLAIIEVNAFRFHKKKFHCASENVALLNGIIKLFGVYHWREN